MDILKILGIVFLGIIMLVAGVNILNEHDNDLLAAHPPDDPKYHHFPEEDDI